jgi:glycosyltransferase involved in cell wall biosynthesis
MTKTIVVMATYNGVKHLTKQLDSIRNQSLAPSYVLVRDDGSSDGTADFVRDYITQYNLSGWQVLENDQNQGWKKTFWQLVQDAETLDYDVLFFADQDDVWHLDKNAKQVEVLMSTPSMELLSADYDVVDEQHVDGEQVDHNIKLSVIGDGAQRISKYPVKEDFTAYRYGFSFAIKKSLVSAVVPFYDAARYGALAHDRFFTVVSSYTRSGYNLNEVIAAHIFYGGNASAKPFISLESSKADHLWELGNSAKYFELTAKVLRSRGADDLAVKAEGIASFYNERAQNQNIVTTLRTLVTKWSSYTNMNSRIRDVIFAMKRNQKN